MQCLDCGYAIDGVRSSACPECGRPFDPNDRGSYRRMLHDPVRVHSAGSVGVVYTMCVALEDAGVHAVVEDMAGGVIGIAEHGGGAVWVNRCDEKQAEQLIAEFAARNQGQPWTCACGEVHEPAFEICWNCQAPRPG